MDVCLVRARETLQGCKTGYIIYCKQTWGVMQPRLLIPGRSKPKPAKICGFLPTSQDPTTFRGRLFVFN